MKKLVIVAAIVIGTFEISFAQNNASASVPLSASVIQGLSTAVTGQENFGTIVAGTTPGSLNAQSATVGSSPGNIAMITLTGNGGQLIHVTYDANDPLIKAGATNITFTPSVYGSNSSSNQLSSTAVTSGGTVTLSGTSGSAGNYYFWLGGSLSTLPGGQTPGSYSGTWTVTVTY
ncbi:MAG TPA: DUF4402 domain-containing protein [Candidatus Acidoferrales bacterium]|nr:DUF4402 domain-containing protein [Candidatus Acidoferrales bacterium]